MRRLLPSSPLTRLRYICPRCRTSPITSQKYSAHNATRPSHFRIAIIGSGPAGFYTAYRLLSKLQSAIIDMYEQLPVPYGLVRFGVAPDHPEVKNCQQKFQEVAESPRFNYIGNVRVGHDIPLTSLKPHYDAFIFAYGASEDKRLGIPGEELRGVMSAREFVGWYNGLPQYAGLQPNLDLGNHAIIVGQGNVALDVARILLTSVDVLRNTDITSSALETLSRSRIKSVQVVGRRGPMQASFTVKEVRELMNIPSVAFRPLEPSFYPEDINSLPRVQKRIAQVLIRGSKAPLSTSAKQWELSFLMAPKSIIANADSPELLSAVEFSNMEFAPGTDTLSKAAKVVRTDQTTTVPASLAFRSVGYKSAALPGLEDLNVPFDDKLGIIPNDLHGRVIRADDGVESLSASHIPGMYCAGWVKRGPTGVIASTMDDAFSSADVVVGDWEQGVPFLNSATGSSTGKGWDGIKEDVSKKGVRPVTWDDWKRIDAAERERGSKVGKEREKFRSVEEMLQVLDS